MKQSVLNTYHEIGTHQNGTRNDNMVLGAIRLSLD